MEADKKQKRGNGISRITIRLLQGHIAFATAFFCRRFALWVAFAMLKRLKCVLLFVCNGKTKNCLRLLYLFDKIGFLLHTVCNEREQTQQAYDSKRNQNLHTYAKFDDELLAF